ncbi:MAG: exosortase/archaeosortase family protein [Actinomycetota bacterium]|nr:exosortase/archaeosortase family protein [Actinomycetota bacterium]
MPRHAKPAATARSHRVLWTRWLGAVALAAAGGSLLALAQAWRGLEATLSAHAIQLLTGQTTEAVPARHMLILYKNTSVQSIFVLTSECSVAYLLAALLIGAAPLMLLRQLSPTRTATAISVAAAILVLVNVARLTAIGATVSKWGRDPGLTIAHTYLGSILTVVGTCAAGVAFAAVLVVRRKPSRPAAA